MKKSDFLTNRGSGIFDPKCQNVGLHDFTTEKSCRPTVGVSPDRNSVEIPTGDARTDHSQNERTGFIAIGSDRNTVESTYERISHITGTYMKESADDISEEDDSICDEGENDIAMINIVDAMNFTNDEDDEFPGSYSL